MKVLVCGGRDFADEAAMCSVLRELQDEHGVRLCIITGGAFGADELASEWCRSWGIAHCEFTAAWSWFGGSAGPIRNGWMLEFGQPDLVIAFPGGAGTADMVRRALAAGVRVRKISESKTPEEAHG